MLFISPQKLFSFSRYLNFCNDVSIRKIRLISNFMTPQPGQQTIVIHILLNISRSKGNQTIKFGQLIEYDIRNIFLEKPSTKCGGKNNPQHFSGKSKLSISLYQQSRVLCSQFLLNPKLGLSKYIETKLQTTCFYLILSILKN